MRTSRSFTTAFSKVLILLFLSYLGLAAVASAAEGRGPLSKEVAAQAVAAAQQARERLPARTELGAIRNPRQRLAAARVFDALAEFVAVDPADLGAVQRLVEEADIAVRSFEEEVKEEPATCIFKCRKDRLSCQGDCEGRGCRLSCRFLDFVCQIEVLLNGC